MALEVRNDRDLAIVILAGGNATRFPGKLEHPFGTTPLLLHVYRNLQGTYPIVVSGRGTPGSELDHALDCPIIVDRWPGRGPLGALLSTAGHVKASRIFAVAGDAPKVTHEVLDALLDDWNDGDEAAVPEHDGGLEPLAALYDRDALLREGFPIFNEGKGAMHALLDRLSVRRVSLPSRYFVNINTAADLRVALQ